MQEEELNVALLRNAYAAWHETKGDPSIWIGLLGMELAWGSLADGKPGMEFSRPRASKDEVVGYFQELIEAWSMEFYYINEYVAQGQRVVALGECGWTNRATGKTVKTPKVDIWMFQDGKATQFMEFYDTQTSLAACVP